MRIGSKSTLVLLAVILALCTTTPVVAQRDIIDVNVTNPHGGRPEFTEFTGTYLFKTTIREDFAVLGVMTLNGDGCATSSNLARSWSWRSEEVPSHGVWQDHGNGRMTGRFLTVKVDKAGAPVVIQRSTVELRFKPYTMMGSGTVIVESYSPNQLEIALDPNTTEDPDFPTAHGRFEMHRLVGN